MNRFLLYLAVVVLGASMGACQRTNSLTVVQPDGSWTRTLELKVGKNTMSEEKPKLADSFVVPKGIFWDAKESETEQDVVWRGVRTGKVGESFQEFQILEAPKGLAGSVDAGSSESSIPPSPTKPKVVLASNQVSIRKIDDETYEYLEIVTWKGPKDEMLLQPRPEIVADLMRILPTELQKPESINKIALDVQKGVFLAVFGPSDPIFPVILAHPDLASEKLKERMAASLVASLKEVSPNLEATEVKRITKALLQTLESSEALGTRDPASSNAGSLSFCSMTSRLEVPGAIVETNGRVNSATGQVYWAFYPEAAMLGPVQLRAVFKAKD